KRFIELIAAIVPGREVGLGLEHGLALLFADAGRVAFTVEQAGIAVDIGARAGCAGALALHGEGDAALLVTAPPGELPGFVEMLAVLDHGHGAGEPHAAALAGRPLGHAHCIPAELAFGAEEHRA